MNQPLKDTVSIVAGLAQSLEIEIIRCLLNEGAIVIVPAINADIILQIKNEVSDISTGCLITLISDPLDYERSKEMTDHIQQNYGRIDLVIIVSSKLYSSLPLTELDYTCWDTMQCDSFSYCFIAARIILPLMKRQQRGTFIQICNDPAENTGGTSPLGRIAGTMQVEASILLQKEVSAYGVHYYHVFSDQENDSVDRVKEAEHILHLFYKRKHPSNQLFHKAFHTPLVDSSA